MNGKERFAGAVLLVTLAIGLIIDVFDRSPVGDSTSQQVPESPAASLAKPGDGFCKIEINTATVAQLEILPGIGPKKAEAIVRFRERKGCFLSLSQITEVRGIGEKTLQRIAPYCSVAGEVYPPGD
jgi:competence protein ComEA